jgi:hypothetical protein
MTTAFPVWTGKQGRETEECLLNSHTDIKMVVEAMTNTGSRSATPEPADDSPPGTSQRVCLIGPTFYMMSRIFYSGTPWHPFDDTRSRMAQGDILLRR